VKNTENQDRCPGLPEENDVPSAIQTSQSTRDIITPPSGTCVLTQSKQALAQGQKVLPTLGVAPLLYRVA